MENSGLCAGFCKLLFHDYLPILKQFDGTFFILFLCYREGKQKQTLAQKIVFIILSFYSGLVERFPEIRQLQ